MIRTVSAAAFGTLALLGGQLLAAPALAHLGHGPIGAGEGASLTSVLGALGAVALVAGWSLLPARDGLNRSTLVRIGLRLAAGAAALAGLAVLAG